MGGTYEQLLRLARWSEDRGLVAFARSDHFYSAAQPAHDATEAFTTLAGLARETEKIRLCVLVSPLTFREPAVIAKSAATVDQMSDGRFDLGVGTGWMGEEHDAFGLSLWPMSERFARLEEALTYLRAAFGQQPARYKGEFYRINADVKPAPVGPLPVIVGGTGKKKTPTLAGQYSNEYNQSPRPASILADNIETMRRAAAEAGRNPDEIECSVMGSVLVGRTDESFRTYLETAAEARNSSAEELEERFVTAGMPVGTPERVQETLRSWESAGITKFYVRHMELDDLGLLDEKLETLGA